MLAHEVKNRDERKRLPENKLALGIKRHPDEIARNRNEQVEPKSALYLGNVEIYAESGGPNVGDVDEQDRGDPGPVRRFVVQYPEPPADYEQQERDYRAAEKHGQIEIAGE